VGSKGRQIHTKGTKSMARSFHTFLFALGISAALSVAGMAEPVPTTSASDTAAAPQATTPPPQQIPEVKQAIELFQKRDFDGALKSLETAAKGHSELPPAQVMMFQLFVAAQQPFNARMALEKAVVSNPDDPESFAILGSVAMQDRRVTDAELLYLKSKDVLASFKGSDARKKILEPQILSGLAAVAEARENWDGAKSYLETLLKINAKDAMAQQRLARALFQLKDAAGALQKLRDAAKADPVNVLTPEAALGRFYEQYGDHEDAVKWMTKSLTVAPTDLRTRLIVAQWYLETGQIDEARTHADKALTIEPRSLDAKILRGVVALFQKDFKEAEKWFQEAHLQSPGNFAASNNLALALCEQNDDSKLRRAAEYANANYQQNQKSADAASTLGWVLYKAKDLQRADQALRQAASTGQLSADTAYYLAQISYDLGRKWDAKVLVDAVLKTGRPFSMRKEATELSEKVKNEQPPAPAK
jgi:tetratricopeptide (TPR) repeat protein